MTRVKLAELTSGSGALVLGVGLGALFAEWFGPAANAIAVVGLSLHALGMWDKHRVETRGHAEHGPWSVALYWACWLSLAGLLALLWIRRG